MLCHNDIQLGDKVGHQAVPGHSRKSEMGKPRNPYNLVKTGLQKVLLHQDTHCTVLNCKQGCCRRLLTILRACKLLTYWLRCNDIYDMRWQKQIMSTQCSTHSGLSSIARCTTTFANETSHTSATGFHCMCSSCSRYSPHHRTTRLYYEILNAIEDNLRYFQLTQSFSPLSPAATYDGTMLLFPKSTAALLSSDNA